MSDHEDQFLVFAADDTNRLTEEHGHGEMGRDKVSWLQILQEQTLRKSVG